jgi:hypothetical protein
MSISQSKVSAATSSYTPSPDSESDDRISNDFPDSG